MMPRRYAHLLTIFYAASLDEYQAELDRSVKTGDATTFVDFSIRGFVGRLRHEIEQFRFVWPEQRARIGWFNLVHAVLPDDGDEAASRQIALALSMPDAPTSLLKLSGHKGAPYPRDRVGQRLLRSDLAVLTEYGLARKTMDGWRPSRNLLDD